MFFNCEWWRGETTCFNNRCMCPPGNCAMGGRCINEHVCPTKTLETCESKADCAAQGAAECVSGKCTCEAGACAVDDVCYQRCKKDLGVACSTSCDADLHA